MKARNLFFITLMAISVANGYCQETVFMLLKSERQLADEYFEKRNFPEALSLYLNIAEKSKSDQSIDLKVARCYYFLKQYEQAIATYEKQLKNNLPLRDLYYYAEAQSVIGNYEKAIEYYREYLSRVPDDQFIMQKLWRLNNIEFLYEDSLHYAVQQVSLNTGFGELCAVSYRDGIVFMSNRNELQMIDHIDATLNAPFYRLYFASTFTDTTSGLLQYGKPEMFRHALQSRFHVGPVVFFQKSRKMAFIASADAAGKSGVRNLQLHFAAEQEGSWKITSSFPYNSPHYSISDIAISDDGKLLFFSSDMKGGFGGKDLYRSYYKNGEWTKPINLGSPINTPYDETLPYLHLNNTLYFSSNGHAGLGGLDMFKVKVYEKGFGEVVNLGYPLNTRYDDFGIFMDSLGTHGYFTSNRKNGGFNDDIYEFDMDIQTYPLEIKGVVSYKDHNWDDSSTLKILQNAKLYLIDKIRNITVAHGTTDGAGNFSIMVPYFSKYIIKVSGANIDEGIVSFEIPRHKKIESRYEIVVVKDPFKSPEKPEVK